MLPLRSIDTSEGPTLSDLDDRPIVLQAGAVNRTKCVPTVIDAFSMAEISDRAQLVICGFTNPEVLQTLRQQVAELELADSVRILGALSDHALDALRRKATIATVLRHPIGEAASKVLLDSMVYRLAVITVNGGHYAEVPDDTVLRVESPPSVEEVAEMLSYAVTHRREISQMAERGRRYVTSERTVSNYAEEVVRLTHHAGAIGRRRDLAIDVRDTILRIGFDADDNICDRAVAAATELFGRQAKVAEEIFEPGIDDSSCPSSRRFLLKVEFAGGVESASRRRQGFAQIRCVARRTSTRVPCSVRRRCYARYSITQCRRATSQASMRGSEVGYRPNPRSMIQVSPARR